MSRRPAAAVASPPRWQQQGNGLAKRLSLLAAVLSSFGYEGTTATATTAAAAAAAAAPPPSPPPPPPPGAAVRTTPVAFAPHIPSVLLPVIIVRTTAGSTADFGPWRARSPHRYNGVYSGFEAARVKTVVGATAKKVEADGDDGGGGSRALSRVGEPAGNPRKSSHGLHTDRPECTVPDPTAGKGVVVDSVAVAAAKRRVGALPGTRCSPGLPKWMDTVRRRMLTKEDWLHVHAASGLVRELCHRSALGELMRGKPSVCFFTTTVSCTHRKKRIYVYIYIYIYIVQYVSVLILRSVVERYMQPSCGHKIQK